MICVPRSFFRQARAVLRRARITRHAHGGFGPRVQLVGSPKNLTLRALSFDAAFECRLPGSFDDETLVVPIDCLDDCQGRQDDTVTLERVGNDRLVAQWIDCGIPMHREYPHDPLPEKVTFPAVPDNLAVNPPGLWQALAEGAKSTDNESSRFALGCLQLRGARGQVVATDGRHVLLHDGFQFPWTEQDLLVAPQGVLGCRELASESGVAVGHSGEWALFGVDPWLVWLRIDPQGRFPKVDDVLQPANRAIATVRLSPRDAQFLSASLSRLPGTLCPLREQHLLAGLLAGQAGTISTLEVVDGEQAAGRGEGAAMAWGARSAGEERAFRTGVLQAGAADRVAVLRLASDDW